MTPRATVLLPTFGDAPFAAWALASVQAQTVQDLEICILCDGSPASMVARFQTWAVEDPRIRIFTFPKSPRTGEPYRDEVLGLTRGGIICYCAHDDLWLPHHVEAVLETLRESAFTHTPNQVVTPAPLLRTGDSPIDFVWACDLQDPDCVAGILGGNNRFGLTFGAHRRDSYLQLPERWVTTPDPACPTDLYMWQKFLRAFPSRCRTTPMLTALNFRRVDRQDWTPVQRATELQAYFEGFSNPAFLHLLSAGRRRLING